jgi:hypothetical protein
MRLGKIVSHFDITNTTSNMTTVTTSAYCTSLNDFECDVRTNVNAAILVHFKRWIFRAIKNFNSNWWKSFEKIRSAARRDRIANRWFSIGYIRCTTHRTWRTICQTGFEQREIGVDRKRNHSASCCYRELFKDATDESAIRIVWQRRFYDILIDCILKPWENFRSEKNNCTQWDKRR